MNANECTWCGSKMTEKYGEWKCPKCGLDYHREASA